MKVAGGLLLMIAAVYTALIRIDAMKKRKDTLKAAKDALYSLANELSLSRDTLGSVFGKLKESNTGQAARFFTYLTESIAFIGDEDFHGIWTAAAKAAFPDLTQNEYICFSEPGHVLGRCDVQEQTQTLRRCGENISAKYKMLSEEYPGKRKLTLGLCCAGGAMLVILLA